MWISPDSPHWPSSRLHDLPDKPTIRSDRLWRIVGEAIHRAREASGINAAAFALTVRISRQALHDFEKGKKAPRLETLYRIAKASGKPITFFLPPAEDV